MKTRLLVTALTFAAGIGGASAAELQAASDLAAEARQAARRGQPLVVLYSQPDCRFCETVRKQYLRHLPDDPKRQGIVVRQIDQGSERPLRDFQGKPRTHADVVADAQIKLVPVVAFYGPRGETLASPIVGARIADYYQAYLDGALDDASRQLKAR